MTRANREGAKEAHWRSPNLAERLRGLMEPEAIPSEVAELAAVWHRLPDAVRAGIVAMVRARVAEDDGRCGRLPGLG